VAIASLLAGFLLTAQATPPADLLRALTLADAAARQRAAREIADSGASYERWLLREMDGGSPEGKRALMIAAGLVGSPDTLAALEALAVRSRKPDPQRAFALLVYGALHPRAGADPEADWKRAVTPYERACLLAGLLAQAQRLESDAWITLAVQEPDPTVTALLEVGQVLLGRAPPVRTTDALSFSARLLTSVLPLQPRIQDLAVAEAWALPPEWLLGARRDPPRTFADLRTIPLAGPGFAAALALAEIDRTERPECFAWLDVRLQDPLARGILWGLAGDLGLELPAGNAERVDPAEAAGLLRLALQYPTRAERGAQARLPAARAAFTSASSAADRLPAALMIALAGGQEELELLRVHLEGAEPRERLTLQPVWKFAQRGFGDPALQRAWMARWARELGAGHFGWLDLQGPRWAAHLLTGGTRAAEQDPRLQPPVLALQATQHDYALDASLHYDVVEFLLAGVYRWSVPD
jgi:hypothetical protein